MLNPNKTTKWSMYEPGHEKTCLILYVNNKDADQPVDLHSLISVFVICLLDSIKPIGAISKISRLVSF